MFWVRWFYSLFEWMRLERKRKMFIHTNQSLITSFYIKKLLIFAELAMSQRWSALFCATGAWGGKPIGRVRVKLYLNLIHEWTVPPISKLIFRRVSLSNQIQCYILIFWPGPFWQGLWWISLWKVLREHGVPCSLVNSRNRHL